MKWNSSVKLADYSKFHFNFHINTLIDLSQTLTLKKDLIMFGALHGTVL